jgi:two-component system, OmpR family, response regulator RpaB
MSRARIVVIEDEPAIRRGVVDALCASGYEATEAADGVCGLEEAIRHGIDLVLLDLLLPKRDGLEVLRELRRIRPTLPVIVLTARGSEEDRVRGLHMGADDYVIKPFSARELLARVEAVLRRSVDRPPKLRAAQLGDAFIDFERREVRSPKGERVELSETEVAILSFLAENNRRAVSRAELLTRLWGFGATGNETRTIDMHITRLRAKLREVAGATAGEAILTVRARGYMAGPALLPEADASEGPE